MHDERNAKPGGIPDALLIALLAFLLGLATLVWTSTGLAALFSKGAWPSAVTFTRTPGAVRALIAQPHDIPGAWPDTPPSALSGWGLFWGLFISQLLILLVLTIFVMGVIARTRSRRSKPGPPPVPADPHPVAHPAPSVFEARGSGGGASGSAGPTVPAAPHQAPTPPVPAPVPHPAPPAFEARGHGATAADNSGGNGTTRMAYGSPAQRHPLALQALAAAEGAALVVTSSPALWAETKDARAKLGPVLLYDPSHLCDTPARMHWNPADACADRDTAAARAIALLAPVRPQARMDAAIADTAETLLRSWLQAVALDDRPFKQLHRWAQGNSAQDPVRILRTHPQAAPGAAGELESALTAHPERREQAQHLTARALSCLTSIHIREACNPNRTDALTLASFVAEGGTLYVVGESLEDPRTHPGAMPLLTALAASVVEHGRRMAARSSHGRLDPPLALVLEDVAAVAPIPQLPELLQEGPLPLLALSRSREQARARWPEAAALQH
ncbi:type IV secretory system conjugative DNA transfer family protein [Streptomyces flavotricini]|uniref:Type IV secretory system conjugative DNA transfer family protein n=1 Tax=Streptomyces flavotricini TaxID=66888 RepID=A0ABS8E8J0_9ACTN|nr:type IV secretory system conjugative DNA transfer family protein [Streptomyces flavotricini]MCC0097323.1 type IV secretory system conjugative DNA transfer family protein [Streptomyces flavotricini]